MNVDLIICDAVSQAEGKLYMLGAGWTHARPPLGVPIPLALAIIVEIAWTEANKPFAITVELQDQDGKPVKPDGENPVRMEGRGEAGRPPGIAVGSALNTTMALPFGLVPLEPNGYVWVVEINGTEMARKPFWVQQG